MTWKLHYLCLIHACNILDIITAGLFQPYCPHFDHHHTPNILVYFFSSTIQRIVGLSYSASMGGALWLKFCMQNQSLKLQKIFTWNMIYVLWYANWRSLSKAHNSDMDFNWIMAFCELLWNSRVNFCLHHQSLKLLKVFTLDSIHLLVFRIIIWGHCPRTITVLCIWIKSSFLVIPRLLNIKALVLLSRTEDSLLSVLFYWQLLFFLSFYYSFIEQK